MVLPWIVPSSGSAHGRETCAPSRGPAAAPRACALEQTPLIRDAVSASEMPATGSKRTERALRRGMGPLRTLMRRSETLGRFRGESRKLHRVCSGGGEERAEAPAAPLVQVERARIALFGHAADVLVDLARAHDALVAVVVLVATKAAKRQVATVIKPLTNARDTGGEL